MRLAAATLLQACLALSAAAASAHGQAALDATTAPAAGAPVRVALADTAVHFRRALFVRRLAAQEGRLVRLDDDAVTVRLPAGRELHLPASSVRRLEVRTGPGYCRASGVTLASCLLAGVAGGVLWQSVVETTMGEPRTRRTMLRGVGIGLVFGLATARDRWAPVPGWPAE